MGEFAIGQGVARFEDPRLIRGGGRYTDDVKLPGMAHGVMLRSPHAHARIKSIDTKAAKAAPGVLCVLTSADVKAAGLGELPVPAGLKRRDGSPQYVPRYPILAEEFVRWVGDRRRLCRRRDFGAGAGRRRIDRGGLRGTAGGHLDRTGAAAGRAARLGGLRRQYLLRRADRRQGGDRCRLRRAPTAWSSTSSSSTASPPSPWSRAARSAITTRRTGATPSTRRCSVRSRAAPNSPKS